ncbi:MAG TPA: hypothetical protein VNO32_30055 [Candidatus Acidoferrum sp.]|nr:hypothetical protein [Candidatus Acidoferrum sp.]
MFSIPQRELAKSNILLIGPTGSGKVYSQPSKRLRPFDQFI